MEIIKLAIVGNPNVGKTTLFNKLTGLHQKIGNYPGVTVDKKLGFFNYDNIQFEIIDLPGTYSLYPSSKDEEIVSHILNSPYHTDRPDKMIVVADAFNLRRSLLLFQQVQDLGLPVLLVLNMISQSKKHTITIDLEYLEKKTTKIVVVNIRKGIGFEKIKESIKTLNHVKPLDFNPSFLYKAPVQKIQDYYRIDNTYLAWYLLACDNNSFIKDKNYLKQVIHQYKITPKRLQIKETLDRYNKIEKILNKAIIKYSKSYSKISEKIDHYITHPFWGYCIFFILLFLIFQSVYFWSEGPKWIIESIFFNIEIWRYKILPDGPLNNLLFQGIIPSIKSIITFIPQIVILFVFLLLMEESGYIIRVIFLMDNLMRPFGLNGKSIIPLISSSACSIPAIMSTRNIENSRDRLITILVTPLIACSARLPIYTLIIDLVIPNKYWKIFQFKGIVLMGMYFLGVIAALCVAMIFHKLLKKQYKNYLIIEMPSYKWPVLRNILFAIWIQIKTFTLEAGKIILSVSVIIWILGSFGPENIKLNKKNINIIPLEKSYLGVIGKKIEPIIEPLGYDWKIGIGLLSSFAAREIFVSTMSSIYSLNNIGSTLTLQQKMQKEINPKTGRKTYNLATGISLLIFYAFSMQCISTLSIVKKETKSWKWPIIQLIFMSVLAYFFSYVIYQILK